MEQPKDLPQVLAHAAGISVDASPALIAGIEALLGQGTVTVEHAGRA